MSGVEAWSAISASLVVVLGGLGALARYLIRGAWRITSQWQGTRQVIERLSDDIRALIISKDEEHRLLRAEIGHVAARLERHEDWHRQS